MIDDTVVAIVVLACALAYVVGWYRVAVTCIRENWALGTCHQESPSSYRDGTPVPDQYRWKRSTCPQYHRRGCWRPAVRPSVQDVSRGSMEAVLWPIVLLNRHLRDEAMKFVPVDIETIEARFARIEREAGIEPLPLIESETR